MKLKVNIQVSNKSICQNGVSVMLAGVLKFVMSTFFSQNHKNKGTMLDL